MARSEWSRRQNVKASWFEQARKLSERHAASADLSRAGLTRCLTELHDLVTAIPRGIDEAYKALSEPELTARSLRQMGLMMAGDFSWAPRADAVGDWAMALGGQLRAYDGELFRLAPTHFGPIRDATDWYCARQHAYVVPRRRPSRAAGGPGRNNSLMRRGLVHHRILPAQVGTNPVEIVIVGDLALPGEAPSSCRVGGAGFIDFDLCLDLRHVGSTSRFRAVEGAGEASVYAVLRHVALAFQDGCYAVIWPELSMPPKLREGVRNAVAERMFDPCSAGRPRLWVTGSWHEQDGDRFVNRCRIYDRDGRLRSTYDKMSVFHAAGIGFEDIAVGEKVPVLVTDEAIVCVAICKDFCMLDSAAPSRGLPVDLFLVPSFGGESTLREHIGAGHQIGVATGGAACVMQQMCGDTVETDGDGRASVAAPVGLMLAPAHPGLNVDPRSMVGSGATSP